MTIGHALHEFSAFPQQSIYTVQFLWILNEGSTGFPCTVYCVRFSVASCANWQRVAGQGS